MGNDAAYKIIGIGSIKLKLFDKKVEFVRNMARIQKRLKKGLRLIMHGQVHDIKN